MDWNNKIKFFGTRHQRGWESRIFLLFSINTHFTFIESVWLGLHTKLGGSSLLKLNITRWPIAKEVVWTKGEKNFEKRVKSTWSCYEGTSLEKWLRGMNSLKKGKKMVKICFVWSHIQPKFQPFSGTFISFRVNIINLKWRKEKWRWDVIDNIMSVITFFCIHFKFLRKTK